MKILRSLRLWAVACFAPAFVQLHAENALPAAFIRTGAPTESTTSAETLSAEYRPAGGAGPIVILVGVSHLGSPEYYKAIQSRLDKATVVLYEGIGLDEQLKKGPGAATHEAGVQANLAKALGLVFQLDAIDYRSPKFVNSDLKADKVVGEIKDRGAATNDTQATESLDVLMQALQGSGDIGQMINGFVGMLGQTPEMREMTKAILIEVLGSAGEMIGMAKGASPAMKDLFDVILTERNQVVIGDLRAQIARLKPGQSVAVFYGAAHMDEISKAVQEQLRYVPVKQEWDIAFTADPSKAGINTVQLKMMLNIAKQQLKALQQQ